MNIENLKKAKNIVSDLAKGVHPYTKDSLGFEQIVVQDERVVQWLFFVAEQLNDIIIQNEKKYDKIYC